MERAVVQLGADIHQRIAGDHAAFGHFDHRFRRELSHHLAFGILDARDVGQQQQAVGQAQGQLQVRLGVQAVVPAAQVPQPSQEPIEGPVAAVVEAFPLASS